jgi:hypothetical protein
MSRLVLGGLAVCILLAGCAPAAYNKAQAPDGLTCDYAAMSRVEQGSMGRAHTIVWVNCPQRSLRT